MGVTNVDRFAESLRDVDVAVTRTTTDGFGEALGEVVAEPAVGAELPFEGVSVADHGVNVEPTAADLKTARTGVTPAALGIVDYGSLVLRMGADGREHASLYPDRHVTVVAASDVVADVPSAIDRLGPLFRDEQADAIVATGPSATADMGAVVQGVHGPGEVHALVLEDR